MLTLVQCEFVSVETTPLFYAQLFLFYEIFTKIFEYILDRYTTFLTQSTRDMPAYIEKKHYHVGKKLTTSVLYGTQIFYFNPMIFWLEHLFLVENTVKHVHFQDDIQDINAL